MPTDDMTKVLRLTSFEELRPYAGDERKLVRDAAVTALQRLGDDDFDALADEMDAWAEGSQGEQAVAVAALCVPRLLSDPARASRALALLDRVTSSFDPEADGAEALRRELGSGWSVAVAANPEEGLPLFESLAESEDPDRAWIARRNAGKYRMRKVLADG